ncbi:MAG TPA: glycosyltransferase family 4 protein [Mucilaginibacter sp.]|jgi:glycosyltransferase involved in cell wall biosynthesis
MARLLHVSANQFPKLEHGHFTKKIWVELAAGFDHYYIMGRSQTNKFSIETEGNITLYLIPKITDRSLVFVFSSFYLFILIKKYKITHLLAQSAMLGGFSAALASSWFKIPLMTEIHGDIYFKYLKSKSFFNRIISAIIKFSFKKSTVVRSVSKTMTDDLAKFGIIKNVIEIPYRVDFTLFGDPKMDYSLNDPIKIISIGRFVEQKGYDIAIEACNKLSKNYNIKLYLIGGGKLEAHYKKLINGAAVVLVDKLPQSELIPFLKGGDIYIQPSKPFFGEAMPRTILEAMAMKLPIIATNVAAIPGVLSDHHNSILINTNSSDELMNAIVKLIDDRDLREKIALQGYKDAKEKYEWNKVFEMYRNALLYMKFR